MDLVFLHTLKFQISAALLLLLLLFTGSIGHTLYALEQRRSDSTALNLGAKLQLTAQRLTTQGLNYLENAPRDYPTYYRDVRLYYRDVSAHIETFERINRALTTGRFAAS